MKTAEELCLFILSFLKGKNKSTPWHCGPLNDESQMIINDLYKLNNFGFISVDSQPPMLKTYKKQRPYVEGFVKKIDFDKISKTNNFIFWYDYFSSKTGVFVNHQRITREIETRLNTMGILCNNVLPLTIYDNNQIYTTLNPGKFKDSAKEILDILSEYSYTVCKELVNDYYFVFIASENINDQFFFKNLLQ